VRGFTPDSNVPLVSPAQLESVKLSKYNPKASPSKSEGATVARVDWIGIMCGRDLRGLAEDLTRIRWLVFSRETQAFEDATEGEVQTPARLRLLHVHELECDGCPSRPS
jgi:hypothetical protein